MVFELKFGVTIKKFYKYLTIIFNKKYYYIYYQLFKKLYTTTYMGRKTVIGNKMQVILEFFSKDF